MSHFVIGGIDFGVGSAKLSLGQSGQNIEKLEIIADQGRFDEIVAVNESEFRYFPMSLPEFYIIGAPLYDGSLKITSILNARHTIGLSFIGETEVFGELKVDGNKIEIEVETEIFEELYKVWIVAEIGT